MEQTIHDVVNLVDSDTQQILNMTAEEAAALLPSSDPKAVELIQGSYALVEREGERVFLARSLDQPLRYFLAKQEVGPILVVAQRIDEIAAWLHEHGFSDQFQPAYTRMVPAHHVTTLRLLGCPDPRPTYSRFFDPARGTDDGDLDDLGIRYMRALMKEIRFWLAAQPERQPIGVLFSGGVDSGSVLLATLQSLLDLGQNPARLKAFTLNVEGSGTDGIQARYFLRETDLEYLREEISLPVADINPLEAVEVIEDYKTRDVECAAVNIALLKELRSRYPDLKLLIDGDGGDENLKDYPIEENSELTIRSVVNNSMLYQEGWGVGTFKHSETYSGGYSRACTRTFAPLRQFGFRGFSPYTRPSVIQVAESIPFASLADGSHERLYALKAEIVARGVRALLNRELPIYPKRRFQEGAVGKEDFGRIFPYSEEEYRSHYLKAARPKSA